MEMGAAVDIELARLMPAGKHRQKVVREWLAGTMPWVNAEDDSSEDYLIRRWKERFGDKEDGQQPK